ncbi:MAG: hypothetical protein QXL27_09790 [Candidatus Bathyarchaeia archaeon]
MKNIVAIGIAISTVVLISLLVLPLVYPRFPIQIIPLDADGDGLLNLDELRYGTDPSNPDTDGDGLKDGDEIKTYGTSPVSYDTDRDGLSDGSEVLTYKTNPLSYDSDGDGLSDGDEVLTYKTNPLDGDTDDDWLLDGYEVYTSKTNPTKYDTDEDGLNDKDEIERYGTNPLKSDTDGDGLIDGRELKMDTDPRNPDTDGDGVLDGVDIAPKGNAMLVITIDYWEEKRSADPLGNPGDPYFIVKVYDVKGKLIDESKLGPFSNVEKSTDLGSIWLDIPDDERSFTITIEAWDEDRPWSADDHYDINPSLEEYDLKISYDVKLEKITKQYDGSLDGSTKDLDGLVKLSIRVEEGPVLLVSV